MQRRYPLVALVAVGVVAAAGPVHAESSAEPTTAAATTSGSIQARPETITLPTGDQVRMTADGSYLTEPVDGGAGAFHTTVEPDGDRLVVPVEALTEIADGSLAVEQFNIDALARNGIADARDPGAARLLGAEAEAQGGDPALVQFDFTGLWPDGSAPEVAALQWDDIDTDEPGGAFLLDGTGTLEMAPGRYHVVVAMTDGAASSGVMGIMDLTVTASTADVVFDSASARPVGWELDRPTVPGDFAAAVFSFAPGTATGPQSGMIVPGDWSVSVVPTTFEDAAGRDIGLSLQQGLFSEPGTPEPYSYSLDERRFGGIPADPVFHVDDEDLAVVEMDYQSLGADARMLRVNDSTHAVYGRSNYLGAGVVDLPSRRTEFYTADPQVSWSHIGLIPARGDDDEEFQDEEEATAEVLHGGGVLEAGSTTRTTWNQGPVTVGLDFAGAVGYEPRFALMESLGGMLTHPMMFSSGGEDEAVMSSGLPGQTVLARDGLGVNKSQSGGALYTDLALLGEGRYTLYSEATRNVPWTTMGTASTAQWEFALESVTGDTVLDASVVDFDAEGIENGYAPVDEPQAVTLDYATQPGAEQQACTAMTFEVSYDDGATWEPVAIDRDGNRATAELTHPEGAAFVSVRFSAADEAGNTVTHSTIRSYGLR
jgi:hypothetical protein